MARREFKTSFQIPLPVRMCDDIDTCVENSRTANICEAVRTVAIIIRFLVKVSFFLTYIVKFVPYFALKGKSTLCIKSSAYERNLNLF